ncbi:MAG: MHYT domain-containing protein [Planctomycetota bacterium]
MGTELREPRGGWNLLLHGLPALWSVGLIAVGASNLEGTWGAVALGAGALSLVVVAVGFVMRSWLASIYGALLLAAIGVIVAGAIPGSGSVIALGVLAVTIVGATAPVAMLLRRQAPGGGGVARSVTGASSDPVMDLVRQIHEHTMLSDSAKRVLFREREMGLLRDAIELDIHEGKYNVALTLCDEMADVFGYREEAEAFRSRILQARQEHYEADVGAAIAHLDETLAARDWALVHHEAARIRRLYGDSHLVQDLDQRILAARQEHKEELEQQFLHAAGRDDVEKAMTLLKQLDRYLDPHEADRLTEVAQGVVTRHRENLGVQFKLAVNDRRWAEAIRIGEVIIDEFPNTKMADEVRSMIDVLRQRANQTSLATE